MYFAYIDETGTDGRSPVLVMAGLVVNDERLRRTQNEFSEIFSELASQAGGPLRELKSKDLLAGSGAWKGVPGDQRRRVVTDLCNWLVERKHKLALAAIEHARFVDVPPNATELTQVWQAGAFHIALQLQRAHQGMRNGKGRTVLVLDDNKQGMERLAELVWNPPRWTDDYYGRSPKCHPLDQLIDTPFAVRSHHVGLVQVADLFAALFRRYVELAGQDSEKYQDERKHYGEWVAILAPRLLGQAHRWPTKSGSECARWYTSVAPPPLLALC